jgi:hypothetical protein
VSGIEAVMQGLFSSGMIIFVSNSLRVNNHPKRAAEDFRASCCRFQVISRFLWFIIGFTDFGMGFHMLMFLQLSDGALNNPLKSLKLQYQQMLNAITPMLSVLSVC